MKKWLGLLTVILLFTAACGPTPQNQISNDKIYFFYSNSCPHCHEALEYINKKYSDLPISLVNVANPKGYDLFIACAQKFNLGNQIGTPLFCMGDNHLMGWAPEYESRFDQYARPFMK